MSIMAGSNVYESIADDGGVNEKLCFSACTSSGQLTFMPKIERNNDQNMLDESEEMVNEKNLILNDGVIRNTYNSTGQPPIYYEEPLNSCEEVEIDYKPSFSSMMLCDTKMEDEWEENNQYESSAMDTSFEENQMPSSCQEEVENADDSDEETIATFLTAAGQRLALYAVEDSDEVFAVAVYDESGEPPTNFQFLMKSDVERLIGEGAVRTVKKPTQMKKQLLPNEPPVFPKNTADNFEETQLNNEITKLPQNEQYDTLSNETNFESNEIDQDTTQKSSPLPDVKQQPDFTYIMMENTSVITPSSSPDLDRSEEIVKRDIEEEKNDDELIEQSTVQYLLMENEKSNDELTFADIKEIMGIFGKNENQSLLKKITTSRSSIDSATSRSPIYATSSIDVSPSNDLASSIDLAPSEDPQTLTDPAPIDNFDNIDDSDSIENFHPLNDPEPIENSLPLNNAEPIENFHPLNNPEPIENFDSLNNPESIENFHPLNNPEPIENFDSLNNPEPIENFHPPNNPEPIENFNPLNDLRPIENINRLNDPRPIENVQPQNDSVHVKKFPILTSHRKIPTEKIVITLNTLKKPQKPANTVRKTHLLSSLICRRTNNNNNRSNVPGTSLLIGNNETKNSSSNSAPEIVQISTKAKRPRKQQLTSVNRDDSEIIIQPATFPDENDESMTKRGKRKRKAISRPRYAPKASTKKVKKSRRRKKRVKRRTVEVIEIDIDEDEQISEKTKIVEITIDENKEKGSSDKENEVIMVGDSDDESQNLASTSKMSSSILKCEHCSRSFRQKRVLETHSRICPKSPDTQSRLKGRSSRRNSTRKSNDEMPVAKKEFLCKICQEKFDVVVALARHVRSMHSVRKKGNLANQTMETSENNEESEKIGETSEKNETEMEITLTTPMTRWRKRRKTNSGNHSWTGQKLHCTDCGKWFSSDALLAAHCLQHATKKSEKQIRRCQTCKKLLKSRLLYIRHMRMHSRVKKLQKKLHHTRQATGKLATLRTRGRPQKL